MWIDVGYPRPRPWGRWLPRRWYVTRWRYVARWILWRPIGEPPFDTTRWALPRRLPPSRHPDEEACLCFHVTLRKVRTYLNREAPPVASLISDCLGAGTGCQWCVPFLEELHRQWSNGEDPDLPMSPEDYAAARLSYHRTGERESL